VERQRKDRGMLPVMLLITHALEFESGERETSMLLGWRSGWRMQTLLRVSHWRGGMVKWGDIF